MSALKPQQPWIRKQQRNQMINQQFDVLVIGGGATGAGVFLDALSRGLSCALVDMQDFTAGTSSRSTKLVHGGVRYLEQAVKELNFKKYQLVKDALHERRNMIKMAPHLAWPLNIVTPVKQLWGLPYYRLGLGVYDFLAGDQSLGPSKIEHKEQLKKLCPNLKLEQLKGGVSFYDGQFDDARYGIAMIRTGLEMGGHALNYTEVTQLCKTHGQVSGAQCVDKITGERFTLQARSVVNCTGPWGDSLRQMADEHAQPMLTVSSGIHLVIQQNLLPEGRGVLIPETDDGRVIFMLPWLGKTLIGTSDDAAEITASPEVSEQDISYLLKTCNEWLAQPIERGDITAAWAGLRPLVSRQAKSTADLTRDHVIVFEAGMATLTGGKWTTWRKMAEDCIDQLVQQHGLTARHCGTEALHLVGAQGDTLAAKHTLAHLPEDIQQHLWQAYGDRTPMVLRCGSEQRLLADEPIIDAEIHWIIHFEGACTVDDILNRRLRIGMLDETKTEKLRVIVEQILASDEAAA